MLAAAVGLAVALAAPAQAGEYTYWTCHGPDGRVTSTEGWKAEGVTNTNGQTDTCASGGALQVRIGISRLRGEHQVQWRFRPPEGVTITRVRASQRATVATGADTPTTTPASANHIGVAVWMKNLAGEFPFLHTCVAADGCTAFDADVDLPASATSIAFQAGCRGPANAWCPPGAVAELRWSAAAIRLQEDAAPTATIAGGTALDGTPLVERETLTLQAADGASGVREAEVRLGGAVLVPRTGGLAALTGPRCAPIGSDPARAEFAFPDPCPRTLETTFGLDTAQVPDGDHPLTVTVWDAAGNATVALSRTVTVANGKPNGSGGDPASGRLQATPIQRVRVVTYGGFAPLRTKLLDASRRPIAGGQVDVFASGGTLGSRGAKLTTVTSTTDGSVSFDPGEVSTRRSFEFAYAPVAGSSAYRDRQIFTQRVRARVTFSASRRTARSRQAVRFTGRVHAAAMPQRRLTVLIQYRSKGRWRTADDLRARRDGSFTWTYRYGVRTDYPMRARVVGGSGLPAEPGTSRTVTVRVR